MKGSDMLGMMSSKAPAAAAAMEPAEGEYGADSVRKEADLAAQEFARNPNAETFRAVKTLCEELEAMEGYEDEAAPAAPTMME